MTSSIPNNKNQHQQQPKFAMDISLYRYAKQLRLLGCDVLCDEVHKQQSLIDASEQENRIVITSVGKTIPLLHKYTLIGDLTFGKAFENLKVVSVPKKNSASSCAQQVQAIKKKKTKRRLNKNGDNDFDEESNGEEENHSADDESDDDEKENGAATTGYAAFLEDPSATTTKQDPRNFHWVEEEDPETKKMKRRRRRLVGYNSDGDSDYEYEEEKKTEAKIRQEEEEAEMRRKVREQKLAAKKRDKKNEEGNASYQPSVLMEEVLRKLTALVKTATPGSVAAIAANACNSALQHAQKHHLHQSDSLSYIVVDIHANFKQMLSAIILMAGVSWIPSVLFTRCVKCNEKIKEVAKESVKDIVTPPIYRLYQNFYQCPDCKNVFWGVDNGLVVNFKSARTTEYLRSLFEDGAEANPLTMMKSGSSNSSSGMMMTMSSSSQEHLSTSFENNNSTIIPARTSRQAAKWGFMPRHIFSFPRKVKVVIFEFMTHQELDNLVAACPMFRELVDKKKKGMDMKFVPEAKMRVLRAQQQQQQKKNGNDEE